MKVWSQRNKRMRTSQRGNCGRRNSTMAPKIPSHWFNCPVWSLLFECGQGLWLWWDSFSPPWLYHPTWQRAYYILSSRLLFMIFPKQAGRRFSCWLWRRKLLCYKKGPMSRTWLYPLGVHRDLRSIASKENKDLCPSIWMTLEEALSSKMRL